MDRTGILLEVDRRARVDLTMRVGEVKQVMEVQGSVTTVDTASSTVKDVVDSNRMDILPLNGRNALSLQGILPGAIQMGSGSAATGTALNTNLVFSVNGTRASQSAYILDGGLNMEMYNNVPAAFPNPDTLQEFSILQNGYSAVNGRNAGAVVNMITKSGTNQLHGVLYDFLRNNDFDSRNFFSPTISPLHRNQFGGNFGGPVVVPHYNGRDRTFFFFGFEAMTANSGPDQFFHRGADSARAAGRLLAEFRAREADHRRAAQHRHGAESHGSAIPRQRDPAEPVGSGGPELHQSIPALAQ